MVCPKNILPTCSLKNGTLPTSIPTVTNTNSLKKTIAIKSKLFPLKKKKNFPVLVHSLFHIVIHSINIKT